MRSKKLCSAMLAATVAASMLWGCGAPSTDSKKTESVTTKDTAAQQSPESGDQTLRVTVQAWMMGKYDFERIAKEFEAENPGVKVVYNQVDNVDVTTSMLEWSQGKTTCDLALGGDRSETVPYAANDYVVEFTDDNFFNGDFTRDKFIDSFLESGNADGVQYMIPLLGEVLGCVVNIPMMKEAGYVDADGKILPAKSWDDMYEYAKNLTKDGHTGLAIDWGNNMAVKAYDACVMGVNGNLYESDGKTLNFTAVPVKGMISVWQNLVKDGYTTTDVFADAEANRTNFKAGHVAMHIAPASRWIEAGEILGSDNVGIMPIPGTDTNGSISYIHGAVIPKASDKQELAIKFIKDKLLQAQFQMDSMGAYGKMSPIKAHYENLKNPYWPEVMEFTEKASTPPLYKDYTKLDTNMQIELQKMLTGGSTADEFSTNMSKFMTTIDLESGMKK